MKLLLDVTITGTGIGVHDDKAGIFLTGLRWSDIPI